MIITNVRPAYPLVDVGAIKAQLRLDGDDEGGYLGDLIDAAGEYAESALDASLVTRTITARYDLRDVAAYLPDARGHRLPLPRGPVSSITSVTDADGNAVTAFTHERDGFADFLVIRQGYAEPATVVYVAGYGDDPLLVPADIRMAIRTHVASLYWNRESVSADGITPVPHSLESFYARKRRSAPIA